MTEELARCGKDRVSERIERHMEDNWNLWFDGNVSAKRRRILLTQFAGEAWQELCEQQDTITRAFEACGLLLNP